MPDHIPVGYGNYVRHAPVGHHQAQADIAIILRDDIFYPDSCVFRDFLAAAPGLYRRIPKNIIRIPAKLRFLAKLWRFFMSHLVFPHLPYQGKQQQRHKTALYNLFSSDSFIHSNDILFLNTISFQGALAVVSGKRWEKFLHAF